MWSDKWKCLNCFNRNLTKALKGWKQSGAVRKVFTFTYNNSHIQKTVTFKHSDKTKNTENNREYKYYTWQTTAESLHTNHKQAQRPQQHTWYTYKRMSAAQFIECHFKQYREKYDDEYTTVKVLTAEHNQTATHTSESFSLHRDTKKSATPL